MIISPETLTEASSICPGCGWVENPGAGSCRSCGHLMPDAGHASVPSPKSPQQNGRRPGVPGVASPTFQNPRIAPRPISPGIGTLPFFSRGRALGLLGVFAVIWHFSIGGTVTHLPGILIKDEPLQGPVPAGHGFWQSGDTRIRALASYNIKGRVLHVERYRWDAMADLAPIDLGVGWGVMSDEIYAARCQFSNSGRYLSWSWSGNDFPAETASRCMTNMHLLPANDRVRDRLLSLRPGQLFQAGGYLVEVMRPGMGRWTSSLSRLDTGEGACEIMWVQSLVLLP